MIRSATQGSTDALAEGLSGTAQNITIAIAIGAVLALVLAAVMRRQVLGAGEDSAAERSSPAVEQDGAAAHPRRRVATLGWVAVALALLLFALPADSWGMRAARSAAFVVGVAFSAVLGYFARTLALRADIRVAAAAGTGAGGYERDLRLASRTGGVVGLTTVGLGLLGAAIAVLVYGRDAPILLEGLGLGAAVSAVFLRLGARTGTGAADIGMAPDLFGSYVVTIAAAVFLGPGAIGDDGLVLPLLIPAIGAVAAALAVLLVRVRQGVPGPRSIRNEFSAGVGVALLGAALACFLVLPSRFSDLTGAGVTVAALNGDPRTVALGAVFLGILLVVLIRWISAHVSSVSRPPLVPPGFGSGLESAVYTTLVIAGALYLAFLLAGGVLVLATFLVALVGCGVLSTVGVIVAMDTVARVSDDARGIAEMEGDVDEEGGAV
ncbi:MAG: sodium/proton-translocating pyrophosphatase, partial [Janthinobacterium lividum]